MPTEDELLAVIGQIYDAASDSGFWSQALESVATVAGGTAAILLRLDHESFAPDFTIDYNLDPDGVSEYAAYYHSVDLWAAGVKRCAPGEVVRGGEVVVRSEFLGAEWYNDFLKPHDLHGILMGKVATDSRAQCVISVLTDDPDEPYDDSQIAATRKLLPHLNRAVEFATQFSNANLQAAVSAHTIDQLPYSLVLLDSDGRILFRNRCAQSIFEAADAIMAGPEGLAAIRASDDVRLQSCITSAISASLGRGLGAGGAISLMRRVSPRPYSVIVAPISQRETIFASLRPAAVVLIGNPDVNPEVPVQRLRRLYGLTKREADIAALAATGLTPNECAERLHIAPRTVHVHLQKIFAKTDTNGRSQLVKLLLTSPLGLGFR